MNLKTKSLNSMLDIHPSFAFLLWLAEDFYLNLLSLTSIFPDGFPLNKLKTGIGILAVVVYFSAVKLLFLMDDLQKIITAFELHSVEGIKECFENGINPNTIINGRPVVYDLIDMYSRGPMFKKCIQVFVESGLKFEDKVLLAVLLDDATSLEAELKSNIEALTKSYSFNCTFTPLYEASLLHICAEYNHLSCAKILVKHGADINTKILLTSVHTLF